MKDANYISEKYKKYLLKIVFAEQQYYTVFGTDLSDNESDKLLVDADRNLLLFSRPSDLLNAILKKHSFFDNERWHEWATQTTGAMPPYAVINFDVLSKNRVELKDIELFNSIYNTLGVVEDYSIQVGDNRLLTLFEKDIISHFKDDLADYFVWSETKVFKISVDLDALLLTLKEMYERLKDVTTKVL